MSTVIFLSSLNPIEKNDGTINASGTVEFYQQGTAFATTKAVYADSGLVTSLGSVITLDSAGHLECYLNGDYDIKIKDSSGALVRSAHNINPVTAVSGVDPSLIPNGSFENTNFTNWTLFEWNVGANIVDNVDQTHGSYSAKFVSAGGGGGYITSALFDCNPATNIFASFSLKSSVANVRNIVQLLWYDKNQAFLSSTTLLDDSATNPTSWTNKTYSSTPPANAVFGAIKLVGCDSSVATAGNTRYDNVYIAEDENNLVHLTGSINETVTGNKTFSGTTTFSLAPVLPNNSILDASIAALGRFQTFIGSAAAGNFTAPKAGNYLVIAKGAGAGGGGGKSAQSAIGESGEGGAEGELVIAIVTLTANQVVAVTPGLKGSGGAADTDGSVGSNSTFGALVTANGGAAGKKGSGTYGTPGSGTLGPRGVRGGGPGGGSGGPGSLNSNAGNGGNASANSGAGGGGGGAAMDLTGVLRTGGAGGNGADGWVAIFW